jgi:anthranilate phosphoribosyltransferase
MTEHPFAAFVRILGKGPNLSRSLTLPETRQAVGMILDGQVDPIQLGAFLCLLRVKTETPEEVAGFALGIKDRLHLPSDLPPVDLDWPSYAGKSRHLPVFLLSALLLAQNGIKVAMHGASGHTAGRLYSDSALGQLGIAPATTQYDAARQLERTNFTFLPMAVLHPMLPRIMELKTLLGLRSPLHTVARSLNPFNARVSLMSVFHPNYRPVHRDAAKLMGFGELACFKGEGGEIERRPEKPCLVEGLRQGAAFEEEWAPLLPAGPGTDAEMDVGRLSALWRGRAEDAYAETTIAATAAVALRQLGRAQSMTEAEALAQSLWRQRRKASLPADFA